MIANIARNYYRHVMDQYDVQKIFWGVHFIMLVNLLWHLLYGQLFAGRP